jgi:hypothetical protein
MTNITLNINPTPTNLVATTQATQPPTTVTPVAPTTTTTAAVTNTPTTPANNQQLTTTNQAPAAPVVDKPTPSNNGGLKIDGDKIITAGGYTISATSQFEWKITGSDGKTTRVWGDPHVDEGDGGKWDFKRDSTFVLGDGTRINVTTTPFSGDPSMTVTKGLEIISGNDRVLVTDIDKGKGKVGNITKDGFANVNSFQGKDAFVMGMETDDWSYKGNEIVGSKNGGDEFITGNALPVGTTPVYTTQTTTPAQTTVSNPSTPNSASLVDIQNIIKNMFNSLSTLLSGLSWSNPSVPTTATSTSPTTTTNQTSNPTSSNDLALQRMDALQKLMAAINNLFNTTNAWFNSKNQINSNVGSTTVMA